MRCFTSDTAVTKQNSACKSLLYYILLLLLLLLFFFKIIIIIIIIIIITINFAPASAKPSRRSTYKNCTGRQIICRRRPSYLEQSATQHSWLDTVGGNIHNTVKNLPVCLGPRRWCFWTSASEVYITIRYDTIMDLMVIFTTYGHF